MLFEQPISRDFLQTKATNVFLRGGVARRAKTINRDGLIVAHYQSGCFACC